MAWIAPKTNWVDGDYFNLSPDYNRSKGNSEYLILLSKTMYVDYSTPTLETAVITGYPKVSFFNNVVNATKAILESCYSPTGARSMKLYASNGVAWTASELNAIEGNHLLLYHAFRGQKAGIPKLEMTLGGKHIGG
jgi:hypothetical protein